jgi:hypothetical protein
MVVISTNNYSPSRISRDQQRLYSFPSKTREMHLKRASNRLRLHGSLMVTSNALS